MPGEASLRVSAGARTGTRGVPGTAARRKPAPHVPA